MGLPLFITPSEPEAAPNAIDKSSARARSSIRRQRTIRRLRGIRAVDRDASGLRSSLTLESTPADDSPQELRETSDFNAESESWPRVSGSADNLAQVSSTTDEWARRPRPSAMRTLRDVNPRSQPETLPTSFFSPYSQSTNVPPVPPVPESGDFRSRYPSRTERRANLLRLHETRATLRRLARQQPTSTLSETLPVLSSNNDSPRLPALTPDFSPAHRYVMNEAPSRNNDSGWLDAHIDDLTSLSDELPFLRRMRAGGRTIHDLLASGLRSRVPRLDGLGDRDRSLSPDGDNAWDTLLTSITPDPQPPSVGSSFASTSAAASASSNPVSSATSLTTIDSIGDGAFENACDIIEDPNDLSDTDLEDDEEIYELPGDSHAVRDRFWRSYADVVVARADRVARSVLPEADPLGGMQRIVRRLARREDIPDEWWAEVGLSRTFPHQSST